MTPRARVAVIFTGGTIESLGRDRLDLAWYIENDRRLTNRQVLERVPELAGVAEVQEVPFRKLPSHALADRDWLALLRTVHEVFEHDRADGVVITHGTNTLEETAHFLHLTLESTGRWFWWGPCGPPPPSAPTVT